MNWNFDFPVEIIRSGRTRSASIQLVGDVIKVRVPNDLSDEKIFELINKRSASIQQKLKEITAELHPKSFSCCSNRVPPEVTSN